MNMKSNINYDQMSEAAFGHAVVSCLKIGYKVGFGYLIRPLSKYHVEILGSLAL